ncbi:hypothetical protein HNR59_002863 [Aquamicrobium lusatiense]|uniref:Uncharacterized protein n=1 Tax=Aquamicrobium lusatiense TaxID=89772 RepID=A0A7W9VV53_9HYPH|nr:hypothetical protein [Aquamicrobium lusatiense]MBB6013474.1 hypothetical protein [Aquamicrobium lusatiense]
MSDPFYRPFETIQWAREAINEFESTLREFFDSKPYGEVTDLDAETGDSVLKFKLIRDLPTGLARKATEALNNIRHSFDQGLYAGCVAVKRRPKKDIHFPWSTTPSDLEGKLSRHNDVIPSEFWDIIRGEHPYPASERYPGGDDIIRELAKIANGKHTIGLKVVGMVSGVRYPDARSGPLGGGPFSLPFPQWNSEKNELIIARYQGDWRFKNNYEIAFQVALDEAGPLRNVPVTAAFHAFAEKSEQFTKALKIKAIELQGDSSE